MFKKDSMNCRPSRRTFLKAAGTAALLPGLVPLKHLSATEHWAQPQGDSTSSNQGIDSKEFAAPTADLVAFWFWNGDMQPEEMNRQLQAIKDAGIHIVVFHPRAGLGGRFGCCELEYYFSDTYFDRVKSGLETCRRLGMKVIFWDECVWPSGFGGGRVLRGGTVGKRQIRPNPEFVAQYLAMEAIPISAGEIHRDGPWRIPEGKLVGVIAAQAQKDGLLRSTFRNLTAQVSDGRLPWEVPEGDWQLMFFLQRNETADSVLGVSTEKNPPCCPDLMNPAAVDKFIDVTHEEYYRRFSEYFGITVVAFFTDEPGFFNNRIDGHEPNTVPWTEVLPEVFEQKKGYSLIDSLPLLWMGEREENAKLQTDFWDTVSALYMNTYFRKIHDWCQAHGTESLGHVLEDTLRFHRTFEGGDFFKTMRYLHRAGIDQIAQRQFGLINPKLGSSAAHLFGRPHALCESFGSYGWDLTLEKMKAIINWNSVNGIDTECLHAFYYTVEGQQKYDSPPDMFYHQLWKNHFHRFVEYTLRVLYLVGRGRQVADIAVLYPTTAIMTVGGISNFAPLGQLEEYFLASATALQASQHDFNYVDELALAGNTDLDVPIRVTSKRLEVGDGSYSVVVLPAVPSLSGAAARKLEDFYRQGGTLIAVGRLPVSCTDGATAVLQSFLQNVFGTVEARPTTDINRSNAAGGRAVFVPILNMVSGEDLARQPSSPTLPTTMAQGRDLDFTQPWIRQFLDTVRQTTPADVQISSFHPSVAFLHKRAGKEDWYVLVNDSAQTVADDFAFASRGVPSFWDPESGKVKNAPVFREESGKMSIPITLSPYGAIAVVFDREGPPRDVPHLTRCDAAVVAAECKENHLKAILETEAQGSISVNAIHQGRPLTSSIVQPEGLIPMPVEGPWLFHLEGVDKSALPRPLGSWTDTWPDFSGTGWYEKDIDVKEAWLAPGRKVYLDLGIVKEIAAVQINGQSAGVLLWAPYRLEITALLKVGGNHLEIGVTNTLANRYVESKSGVPAKPASGLLGPVRIVPAKVIECEFTT